MARIRSIHPSLFTDEDFMSLSLVARVVLPGLWTECDDQGLFAWKPLTLKARLLPADNADMSAILNELEGASFIHAFTLDGKQFGAVRNFRKFQKPKKPNAVLTLPAELRTYVGLLADGSAPVTHKGGTEGEKPVLMEDGGEDVEDDEKEVGGLPSGTPSTRVEFIRIPTNRYSKAGQEHVVFEDEILEFEGLYPAVDVRGQIRAMRGWSISNSEKRKTDKGMARFINSWLSNEQNKGNSGGQGRRRDGKTGHDKFFDAGASLVRDILGPAEGGNDYPAPLQIGGPLLPP